jgi:hypothetical protein
MNMIALIGEHARGASAPRSLAQLIGAKIMANWLDTGAALTAFFAAGLWFLSAYGKLPPMRAYYDQAPDTDPFFKAIKFSARMNSLAAVFSGLSASLLGVKLALLPA